MLFSCWDVRKPKYPYCEKLSLTFTAASTSAHCSSGVGLCLYFPLLLPRAANSRLLNSVGFGAAGEQCDKASFLCRPWRGYANMISPAVPTRTLHTISALSAAIFWSLLLQIESGILARIKSAGFFHIPFSGATMCWKFVSLSSCPLERHGLWCAWCIYMCTSVPTSPAVLPLLRGRHRLLCLLSCQPPGTGGDTGFSLADVRGKDLQ